MLDYSLGAMVTAGWLLYSVDSILAGLSMPELEWVFSELMCKYFRDTPSLLLMGIKA